MGVPELVVIVLVLLVVFRLPSLIKGSAKAITDFRKGIR